MPKALHNQIKPEIPVQHTPMFKNNAFGFTGKGFVPRVGAPTFNQSDIGTRQKVVDKGFQIQDAIDELNAEGGGILFLKNATYLLEEDIILYSNIYLRGENAGSTILDFQNNGAGVRAIGTDAYEDGTVTISNGGVSVVGSGTLWSSNLVAGQSILLGALWYPIAVVNSDTTVTIAVPYAGFDLSGDNYVAATKKTDIKISDLTIKQAGTAGVTSQYTDEVFLSDVDIQQCAVAVDFDDMSNFALRDVDASVNNAGYNLTNCHLFEFSASGSVDALVGNGITLDTCTNAAVITSFFLNSAGDGMSFTNCNNLQIATASHENGGQGIEFVSGNKDIFVTPSAIQNNDSDGIKLTATSDNIFIVGVTIKGNGGYGVNIAASTCDDNVISSNVFANNSTDAVNDGGTGTVIRGNIGVSDNKTSGSFAAKTTTFTSSGTWTKASGAVRVRIETWGGGGSGGNGANNAGGGGGGEYVSSEFNADDLGATETVTIGAGGAGVSTDDTSGNTGGDTTFGSHLTANGGRGGVSDGGVSQDVAGGDGGTSLSSIGTGQVWGVAVTADVGGSGLYSAAGGGVDDGLSRGKAGGSSVHGGAGGGGISDKGTASSGDGGTSNFGGDGGAAGTDGGNGTAGSAKGGGGGAASNEGGGSSVTSGAGGRGHMIITEFL